jgi:hypothetical protein
MRYLPASAIIVLAIVTAPRLPAQASTTGSGASGGPVQGVRHVIGLENVGSQKNGKLSVQNGAMEFDFGKSSAKVPVASIDDIFVGSETTQGGGPVGRLVKTASMAAPYESGKVLTLLLRTKVDILTVSYRDESGARHGAILALPKGQAIDMRTRLIAAGAHASASSEPQLQERKQP